MTEKLRFCSPPIWDRKYCRYSTSAGNFSTEYQFPAPDWGSVGPVLNYKDENKTGIEFGNKIVSKVSPSFYPIKNTTTECPISRASPCAIPINILETAAIRTGLKYGGDNEDKSMWVNGFNGKLDALEIQGENFIIHPEWRERKQWIVVSSIKAEKSYILNLPPEELEENIVFKKTADIIASDDICQISSKSVGGIGFALLRSKKDASLVVLNGDVDNSELKSTPFNSGCWTVCSSLSSDVAGLWSVISEDGTVEVHPVEGPQIWGTHLKTDSHSGQLRWYECEFGHHPMSLFIAGRSNLFLADLRTAGSRRDNLASSQRNIFKTDNIASFIDPNEQICTFKKCDKNPHVYAVLNKTVLMFDVRHCKVPCMKWQHMMPSMTPNYASTINIDGQNECLILGSKEQQNVCLLAGIWEQENNDSRYCAVGMPHHVNLLRDTAELMHRRGVLFSAAADTRLKTNMIGMVPVNLTNGKEFHLLTINSPGDLISQKFMYNRKEEFREVSQSAVEAWKSWEESISSVNSVTSEGISNNQSKDVVLLDATRFLYENSTQVKKKDNDLTGLPPVICNWNISEKIKDAKERIANREKRGKHHGRVGNVSMNTILMKNYQIEPDYSKDQIKNIKDKHMVDKVDMTDVIRNLPRSVVNSLSNEGLHQFKDSLSLSVLSRWKSSNSNQEDVTKEEFLYGRAPFDPDKLECLPRCLRLEKTEQNQPNSTADDSFLSSNSVTSQIPQTLSKKSYTLSEASSKTPSKTSSSKIPDSSTKPLSRTPVPKKKRKIVAGF